MLSVFKSKYIYSNPNPLLVFSIHCKTAKLKIREGLGVASTQRKRLTVSCTKKGGKKVLAWQRDCAGKDLQQVTVVKDRDGTVLASEENVPIRWKEYFEGLMRK